MQLINPKAKLTITIDGESVDLADPEMRFSIEKDLREDPNEAEFTIYNANVETMNMFSYAASKESPIEFLATTIEDPGGAFISGFRGELYDVENEDIHPGIESILHCVSQKRNHRDFWFQKTYAADTYADDIINDMLTMINLPKGNTWEESTEKIILSKSFAGPAYALLQRFMFDRGMYCYIMDGKIYASLVDVAPSGTLIDCSLYPMRKNPKSITRTARDLVEMKTVIDVTGRIPDAMKKRRVRKSRKKKKTEVYGQNDLVEFEAVDQTLSGMQFTFFLHPEFCPDNMFTHDGIMYRCTSVTHEGNTFGGDWDTTVDADIYHDDGGDFIGDI